MMVGSLHPYILRMVSSFSQIMQRVMKIDYIHPSCALQGVEPRWKGLNTAIPVVMVSKRTYR